MEQDVNISGWKKVKLQKIIQLISGQHIDASDYNTDGVGVPYLTGPSDFKTGKIITTKYTEKPKTICKKGDILITVKGSGVGKTIISDGEYCIGRQLMAIRSSDELRYVIYYNLKNMERQYNSDSTGLIPGISRETILNSIIYYPTEKSQSEKIGQILLLWDKAIQLKDLLIGRKKEQKLGLVQKLLMGHIRWNDRANNSQEEIHKRLDMLNSDQVPVGYKRTKFGLIPNEWNLVKLSDVVKPVSRNVAKPNHGYWRLGIRSHAKGTFHEYIEDPKAISMDTLYVVKKNDLIVNITFAWEHAITVANNDDEGKLVSHRFPTYVFDQRADPQFYKYYVEQAKFKYLLQNVSPGGAGRNRVLNKTDFLNLNIILPPLIEQQAIAKILGTLDREIRCLSMERESLIQQKKGLMQLLLTGKVRVKS
ncbi:restriction endonuclease subunit S [Paenibacillus sp. PDC88]|uniref:restriction endonuclease subunit S n=1 Tax=Paenibacillus sp. PDC88 TaxID=1884375 RepID=UPI00089465AA|nr:restriction endonuclease subunit S [Paenibacillus sp. PDC88]SDX41477.1 type I restriction enzyme, S subunit [Paenibacillus sp. PDC88]